MENPYAAPQGEIRVPSGTATPLTWKQILFSFQGRIPRRQYWGGIGIQMLIFVPIGAIAGFLIPVVSRHGDSSSALPILLGILAIPLGVFAIWVGLALNIKRWHDRDKSGWWMLIGLIPYIGGLWQLIECGCLRGTEGPNRFGEDPT